MDDFRLNEVFTTEKGVRYIGTHKGVVELLGEEEMEYHGIQLMSEGYSSGEVVVSENKLFLCGYEVMDYSQEIERCISLYNQIPRYYVIRKYDEDRGYHSFECGFDLVDDGGVWEGITRTKHNTVSDVIQFFCEKFGDKFTIWLEEPMRL